MNDQIERMAGKFGGSVGKPPKYLVPLIRFDGNHGEFRKIALDETKSKVEEPLKKPVKIIILKKRRLLSAYSPTCSYFTTEHNNVNDVIQLFSNTAGVVKHEMSGIAPDMRQKYQTLKTHEVIYGMLGTGEIIKFEVKGGSLGGYYDYQKKLSADGKHSFQVVTSLGSEKAKNDSGFEYYRVTFKSEALPEKVSLDLVEEKMNEVSAEVQKIDDYFAKRQQQNAEKAPVPVAAVEYPAEEINVDDIPF